jgi:SAM-dependent methyltransferase
MVPNDLDYIRQVLAAGLIYGPVLELGAGYGGDTCRDAIEAAGFAYFASDAFAGPGVDYVADFEKPVAIDRRFGSILVLNVLEHVFEPIEVLDNALLLLESGGTLVVLTPTIWPLHHYPIDSQRLLPSWYDRYAETRGLELVRDLFRFIPGGKVDEFRNERGYCYPPISQSALSLKWSAAVHKLFNTAGRGLTVPSHLAIAAVMQKA